MGDKSVSQMSASVKFKKQPMRNRSVRPPTFHTRTVTHNSTNISQPGDYEYRKSTADYPLKLIGQIFVHRLIITRSLNFDYRADSPPLTFMNLIKWQDLIDLHYGE